MNRDAAAATGDTGDPADPGPVARAWHWYTAHAGRRGLVSPALSWLRNDVLILFVTALELLDYLASGHGNGQVTRAGIAVVALSPQLLLARRDHPVRTLVALIAVQTATALFVPLTHGMSIAVLVALYGVARTAGRSTLAWCFALAVGSSAVRSAAGDDPLMSVVSDILGMALIVFIALWVRQWRRQTELTRRLLAENAVAAERRRIARELHDVVAHHITTMFLMSGGARSVLDHDPAASRDALITLEASAREALGEMRTLLGVLRSDDAPEAPSEPQPGIADIERLVETVTAGGLPVKLQVNGAPPPVPVPATVGLTLYRVVQEALTNTRKHAGGTGATVLLEYRPDDVTVSVTDDGRPSGRTPGRRGSSLAGGGYGLLGMRERVAVHGGSMEAGPRAEGGFLVTATLPLPPP
ncbi:sensor histidine kinase [Streptomyces sp. NPDC059477]|uniref:sensor histidine kinase n=1 Tax=Streptomyces sp. NPDC059477 TaxID=3346847 RepID=UPI0036C9BA58